MSLYVFENVINYSQYLILTTSHHDIDNAHGLQEYLLKI